MESEKKLVDSNEAMIYAQKVFSDTVLLYAIKNVLDNSKTVDAAPAVHGRWEDVVETEMYVPDMKYTVTHTVETCSACNVRIGFIGSKLYLYDNICPNCGAKMDGDWHG